MNKRREFLKQACLGAGIGTAAVAGELALSRPKQVFGYVDWSNSESFPADLLDQCTGGKVFVDGVEIRHVFYVNTDMGRVKTYDVFRDGGYCLTQPEDGTAPFHPDDFLPAVVKCPKDGVVYEVLTGKVELFTV